MSHRNPKPDPIDDAVGRALVESLETFKTERDEARSRVKQLEREVAALTRKCDRAVVIIVDHILAEHGDQ